jgi:cytochrome c-type biogenesis protein CcmH/NrfG
MSENIKSEIVVQLRENRNILICLFSLTVVCVISYGILPSFFRHRQQNIASWDEVRTAMDQQNFSKALAMAKTLVASQPDYDYGQTYLGYIYLAMDDLTNAEAQYARAYQLFPSKIHKENLEAVRERMATGGNSKHLAN